MRKKQGEKERQRERKKKEEEERGSTNGGKRKRQRDSVSVKPYKFPAEGGQVNRLGVGGKATSTHTGDKLVF